MLRVAVAAAVAVVLVAAACASEQHPPRAAPTTVIEAPAPTVSTAESAPEEWSVCEDPASEDLGGGFYRRDGFTYESVDGACLLRRERSSGADISATAADTEMAGGPGLAADPVTVPKGLNTFVVEGTGFDQSLAIFVMACRLPGDTLSAVPTPEEVAAMVAAMVADDCDLDGLQAVNVASDGSFTAQYVAAVTADFLWVAADADKTQAAGAAVLLQTPPTAAAVTREPPAVTEADPTTEPEAEHHADFSHHKPGDVVNIAGIWPDAGYPDDFVCELLDNGEFVDDGHQNCWQTSDAETPRDPDE